MLTSFTIPLHAVKLISPFIVLNLIGIPLCLPQRILRPEKFDLMPRISGFIFIFTDPCLKLNWLNTFFRHGFFQQISYLVPQPNYWWGGSNGP